MKLDEAAAVLSSSAQVSQGCEITIERKDEMELPLKSNPKANRVSFFEMKIHPTHSENELIHPDGIGWCRWTSNEF